MCEYVVVNRVNQFGCRISGYEVYSYSTQEILGLTEKTIVKMLNAGEKVYGLTLDADNKVVLDNENHFQNNIMEKKTISKMESVNGDVPVNTLYTLLSVKENGYEVMNSRYAKQVVTMEKLKTLLELGLVQSGCKMENGELKLAEVFKPSATVVKEPAKEKSVKTEPAQKETPAKEGKPVAVKPDNKKVNEPTRKTEVDKK